MSGSAGAHRLRRLVAERERVAALLRARPRVEPLAEVAAYRSSYAARLWALAEATEPEWGSQPAAPLSLLSRVEPPDAGHDP